MHDLIIVGAGTAGCVLAERLTAPGRLRILLLEAGGQPSSVFVRMPAGFAKLFKSKLDWNFQSEPQAAAGGRTVFIPRGKMLGGSSNMNAQVHQWCHPADFDGWAALGATGWSWNDVAPTFVAQETWDGPSDRTRGRQGPMLISPNHNAHALSRAFVAAARACGLNGPSDYNGGAYEGAWLSQLAHDGGKRFSSYHAYLEPAMKRSNLEVVANASVTGLTIEGDRATGVTVRQNGSARRFDSRCGVIVAAGAFGSPHLLMLSGVGPGDELQRFGIPVRRDSPEVGSNLQDHPIVPLTFRTLREDSAKSAESVSSLARYFLLKRGMLASNGIEAISFARTSLASEDAPDLEIVFAPFEWREQALEPPRVHGFSIGAAVVSPRSRGRLALKSNDPLAAPSIDLGLLSDPSGVDAGVLMEGIQRVRRIVAESPLREETAHEIDPGSNGENADLRAWINTRLQTVYHPSSTCRMGSDARAVVDSNLAVRGVGGLWVADASVIPTVPRGHPNAVVAMIAHRGATMIERAIG